MANDSPIEISKDQFTFSSKNIGRGVKVRGKDHIIEKILANKKRFRVVQGEGIPVEDYSLDDIEAVEGLVIDLK